MERLREFREAFDFSLRKIRRPVMYLPAVIAFALPQVFGIGVLGNMSGLVRDGSTEALQQWSSQYGGLYMLVTFALVLGLPAVVSGMAALAKAGAEREHPDLTDFWGGMGTYYWRVVGAYVLVSLGSAAISALVGGYRGGTAGGILGEGFPAWAVNMVGAYFFTPWIAAAAVDGVSTVEAISRGIKFAWNNPYLLIPGFVLQNALEGLTEMLLGPAVFTGTSVNLTSGWAYKAFFNGAASGFYYAFFLVMYMRMYRMKSAPPAAPVTEAPPPPFAPPSGAAQSPDQ